MNDYSSIIYSGVINQGTPYNDGVSIASKCAINSYSPSSFAGGKNKKVSTKKVSTKKVSAKQVSAKQVSSKQVTSKKKVR